jgi:hypothetical protein
LPGYISVPARLTHLPFLVGRDASRAVRACNARRTPLWPGLASAAAAKRKSQRGRYCCKSPKLFGTDFFVRKQQLLRSPTNRVPNSFPKSPVSLSPGNEVPHIFTQKSRQLPRKILVSSEKGLLQQNRPTPDALRTLEPRIGSDRSPVRKAVFILCVHQAQA